MELIAGSHGYTDQDIPTEFPSEVPQRWEAHTVPGKVGARGSARYLRSAGPLQLYTRSRSLRRRAGVPCEKDSNGGRWERHHPNVQRD